MRTARKLAALVLAGLAALSVGGSVAAAGPPDVRPMAPEVTTNGNPDPTSDGYSPVAWNQVWNPAAVDYTPLVTGDLQTGLRQTGFIVPELFSALTETDRDQLKTQFVGKELLRKVFDRQQKWQYDAFKDTANVPEWSKASSDEVAKMLGGDSYAELTPGLQGVVQRIATVITGDFKPKMPDEQWREWMPAAFAQVFDDRPDKRFDWSAVTVTTGGPANVVEKCDAGVLNWLCAATVATAGFVEGTIDFFDDPFGAIAQKLGEAASGMLGWVTSQANEATTVDLSMSWWIDAYQKAAAVGVALMLIVLLWQLMQRARGKLSNEEVTESFVLWGPGFLAGIIFGPALGQFFVRGAGALTNSIVETLVDVTTKDGTDSLVEASRQAGQSNVIGGSLSAALLLLLVCIACIFIFVSLAAQAAAIYLSAAVFGIAFAWVVSARHRGGSMRIPILFLGIVFSRPLLFFMLGLGLGLTKKAIAGTEDTTQNFALLIMAVVVMSLAAFSPLLLLKFAPVSPAGMGGAIGGGGAVSRPAAHRDGGMSRLGGMAQQGLGRVTTAMKSSGGSGGMGARTTAGAARSGAGAAARGATSALGAATAGAGGGGGSGSGSAPASRTSEVAKGGSAFTRANRAAGLSPFGRSYRHGGGAVSEKMKPLADATRGKGVGTNAINKPGGPRSAGSGTLVGAGTTGGPGGRSGGGRRKGGGSSSDGTSGGNQASQNGAGRRQGGSALGGAARGIGAGVAGAAGVASGTAASGRRIGEGFGDGVGGDSEW